MKHSTVIKTCAIGFAMGIIYSWLKDDMGIIFKPILCAALLVMAIGLFIASYKGISEEETK